MRLQIKWQGGWAYVHGTGPDGKRIRRALKTQDVDRAREACAHLEARLWKIKHYGPESVVTFEEAAIAYVQDGGDKRFITKMAEALAGKVLREITPTMALNAARRVYPKAAPATINRQGITPVQAVINYGHKQGWCGLIRIERLKTEAPTRKAVDANYLTALRPHLPERAFALLTFLQATGRRVGDAIQLTPADRDGCKVTIGKTKNGDPAIAIISPDLAALLDTLPPRHGLIFGYVHRSSLYNTLRKAAERAKVEYLGTHQPGRHSFATMLNGKGWGSKAIADAGGWKSPQLVAKTYEHPVDAQGKAAKIAGKLLANTLKSSSVKVRKSKDNP